MTGVRPDRHCPQTYSGPLSLRDLLLVNPALEVEGKIQTQSQLVLCDWFKIGRGPHWPNQHGCPITGHQTIPPKDRPSPDTMPALRAPSHPHFRCGRLEGLPKATCWVAGSGSPSEPLTASKSLSGNKYVSCLSHLPVKSGKHSYTCWHQFSHCLIQNGIFI